MAKITAEQARLLAGATIQERVDLVYLAIEKAANAKKRIIRLHDDFWGYGGYKETEDWKEAVQILKNDGYRVRFFYEERQFVDMYTIVEW